MELLKGAGKSVFLFAHQPFPQVLLPSSPFYLPVKQAPTNLVARMRKLTFKHNLTDFMRLMKDTVLYPFPGRMPSCLKLTETEMRI